LLADATRIKHIPKAESSIIPIKIRIHQRLDFWVAEICPSRSPIRGCIDKNKNKKKSQKLKFEVGIL
jgi:hypothetical protein